MPKSGVVVASSTEDVTKTKVTSKVVEKVAELVEVRSLANKYSKLDKELTAQVKEEFGEGTTLIHRNLEIARLDTRSRSGFDSDKFIELIQTKYPELWESAISKLAAKCHTNTEYQTLVLLYK